MFRIFFQIGLLLFPVISGGKLLAASTLKPVESQHPGAKERFLSIQSQAKVYHRLVFLGDSITEGYESDASFRKFRKFWTLNAGVSADRVEHVIWRLQNKQFPKWNFVKLTVLLIGTNNWQSPEVVAATYQNLLQEIKKRLPRTKILMVAVLPRGKSKDDPARLRNDQLNRLIRGFADGKSVFYRDYNDTFLDAKNRLDPQLTYDSLHLNTRGYQELTKRLLPDVENLF